MCADLWSDRICIRIPAGLSRTTFAAMRFAVFAAILVSLNALQAQRSTADGVYAPVQAERGRALYGTTCQVCHAADLSGGVGSALKGDQFRSDWGGLPLARLFERIRTMPPGAPAPQPEDATVELLAHLLAANGFPPGETLSIERLEAIQFQSGEPRSDSGLVQVFGCIEEPDDRRVAPHQRDGAGPHHQSRTLS